MKLAACTVLYHSDTSVLENIKSYINEVDYLILVDNSDIPNTLDFSVLEHNRFEYISNNGNLGIASALNTAAKRAQEKGYDWLLTMDQDSFFYEFSLVELKDTLESINEKKNEIGIMSPLHVDATQIKMNKVVDRFKSTDIVMTSGNLLNLKIWEDVGFFDEKLFIDCVDYDFCLRLIFKNYKVLIANNSFLIHPVGNIENIDFFGFKFQITRHSAVRIYYMSRNSYYLISKYYKKFPNHCWSLTIRKIKNVFKITFFEDNKRKKLYASFLGGLDFFKSKYGKCQKTF